MKREHAESLRPRSSRRFPAAAGAADPDELTLWAGDIVVAQRPTLLTTVLGSCVAACLYDEVRGIGGMNHYLLPEGGDTSKHGRWAMEQLIGDLLGAGCRVGDLRAKLFGGGHPLSLKHHEWCVGPDNIRVARRALEARGIPVVTERVGLPAGMRVIFETWSGVAWVRRHGMKA